MSEDQLIDFTEIWDPWIQSWRFSNHAVFRIPEYLASMWGDWHQQSPLLIQEKFEPEPFFYFRHPLTDMVTKPKGWTSKMQFAQSALLTKMLSARNDPNGIGKLEEQLKANAKIVFGSIKNFVNTLNEKQGKSKEWEEFILAIQEKRGSNYLEKEIDFDLLRRLPSKSINVDKAPEILHHLILAFCSVDFRGYVQQRLNKKHLALSAKEREEIVGYCIQLLPEPDLKKLPRIEWMRVLYWNGSSKNLVLNEKEKDQPPPYNILGVNKDTEFAPLLLAMFSAVNGPLALRSQVTQRLVAVPVYEWSAASIDVNSDGPDPTRRHRGGALLGWVLNRFPNPVDPDTGEVDPKAERDLVDKVGWNSLVDSQEGKPLPLLYEHVKTLSLLAEAFASKYMSGDTEWALERKWKPEDTAKTYMERYFHDSCSWRCSFDNLPEENLHKVDLHKVRESYFHPLKDEKGRLLINLSKSASQNDPSGSDQPVIAILTPTVHNLKTDELVEDKYFTSVAEHARYFYRDRVLPIAEQRKAAKDLGQLSGFLETAHDYSKDLNALDHTFGRLQKAIGDTASSIKQSLAGRPEFAEFQDKIHTDLNRLLKIRDHSLLRPRFMMAHLRTQTEGYYYEQPDWIVKRLANGTRGDIYFLFNHLVWEPLGARHYLALLEMPPQEAEVSDWSRLFAYDEIGRHPQVDAFLADYLKQCFLRRPENGGPMTPEQFGARHPPPKINPEQGMTDVILPGLRELVVGIRGLLPLVVFSLRTAFQHAWLTSFIKSGIHGLDAGPFDPVTERVTLSDEMGDDSYTLRIEFPNPFSREILKRWPRDRFDAPISKSELLPWGNWEREVSFYSGLGLPWVASLAASEHDEVFSIDVRSSRR